MWLLRNVVKMFIFGLNIIEKMQQLCIYICVYMYIHTKNEMIYKE